MGMTTAREAMTLALETNKLDLAPHPLESGKELLSLLNATTQILFAMENEQGGVHVLDVLQGRHVHIAVKMLPGSGVKIILCEIPANITGTKHGGHIGDTAISDGDVEAIGVADEPVGHEAAVAAAS